jgi:predicted Zn-dependent peptidase
MIVWLAVAVLTSTSPLSAEKQTPPPGGEPKGFELPAKTDFELENGLKATMVPYGALPKVTVRIVVRVGNLNEAADEIWLSDLANRMLSEGTTSRSATELAAAVASMGGELEINTGLDTTFIQSDVLSEFAADLIEVLTDVVRNPALPEAEVARLQGDMVRELTIAKSRPQTLADERFYARLYGDHPYGRLFPSEEMLRGYGIERIREFHQTNFGARRSHVYVVGRFDPAGVEQAIRDNLGDWQPGPEPLINPPTMQSSRAVHLIDRPDAPQSTLRIGLPVIDPSHDDYMPLVVTNTLLGGYFSSRVTTNIREEKGYTYSPYSAVSVRYGAAHWVQNADVATEVTGASLTEIFKEIDGLRAAAPASAELAAVQNYRAGIFVLQNSIRGGIINQLSFVDLHRLDPSYLTNYVENVYAVTPDKVREIADKYFRSDEMTIVVVGDRARVSSQVATFGSIVD